MYICICNAVTEREIQGAVQLGCRSVDDLRRDLGVASCCGQCAKEVHDVIRGCMAATGGDD